MNPSASGRGLAAAGRMRVAPGGLAATERTNDEDLVPALAAPEVTLPASAVQASAVQASATRAILAW